MIIKTLVTVLLHIHLVPWDTTIVARDELSLKVVRLPENINSPYEEGKPLTSTSGDTLFFVRSFHPGNRGGDLAPCDIWLSVRTDDGKWSPARNDGVPALNDVMPNTIVGVDGRRGGLYFLRYAFQGENRSVEVMRGAVRSGRIEHQAPAGVGLIRVGEEYHDIYMHPAGDVLVISMRSVNALGREDVFISVKDQEGHWSAPLHAGPVVNSRRFEMSPFLSDDKATLYFASDVEGGLGDADIYRSTRLDDGWQNWSVPENVGPPISSKYFDAYYFENGEGESYFVSNRTSEYSDIYRVVSEAEQLRTSEGMETARESVRADQKRVGLDSIIKSGEARDALSPDDTLSCILFFEHDRDVLRDRQWRPLDSLLDKLYQRSAFYIKVVGYTDASGSEAYNRALSFRRAKTVEKFIVERGFENGQMSTEGKGVYRKKDGEKIPDRKRRRVQVIVVRLHDEDNCEK